MTPFQLLATVAGLLFIAHVLLLFTSFGKREYSKSKYLWSHITLWLSGATLFVMSILYAGKGEPVFVDVFSTPFKQVLIMIIAFGLSAIAHLLVKLLVLPRYQA